MTPCRVVDPRPARCSPAPSDRRASCPVRPRAFPIQSSTLCTIPATAQAYSFNLTVVPPVGLGFLSLWPEGRRRASSHCPPSNSGATPVSRWRARWAIAASISRSRNSSSAGERTGWESSSLKSRESVHRNTGEFVPRRQCSRLALFFQTAFPIDQAPGMKLINKHSSDDGGIVPDDALGGSFIGDV